MQHVVITFVTASRIVRMDADGTPDNRYFDTLKSVIQCQSKSEAETIAAMLLKLNVGERREARACLMLRDAAGKACYFDHDYLEHVMSDMTEPEHDSRKLREAI